MLLNTVYPIISASIWALFGAFAAVLLLRLVFSYADPNPFGAVGRFAFRLRKLTEKWVYPASRFLAIYGVDVRLAPLVTLLIAFLLAFFVLQILGNTLFIIDGLAAGFASGRPLVIVGFILYAALSVLVLLIFIRFVSSWFVTTRRKFLNFVVRVTDPVLLPFQRWIPPVGMFDISAMIVLLLINLLQSLVLRVFVAT
jgi:YggT family protein